MVTVAVRTLENASVLEKFEALCESGSSPSLAVYRGREIVIVSEKSTGLIGKIVLLCKKVFYNLLFGVGLLSADPALLQKLKSDVAECLCNGAEKVLEGRLDGLKGAIANRERDFLALQQSISALEHDMAQRTMAKTQLEHEVEALGKQVESSREEIKQHTCHLDLCHQAESKIGKLELKKVSLQRAVDEIVSNYETLQPKKEEIVRLTATISDLQSQIESLKTSLEQHNFKRRYEELSITQDRLERTSMDQRECIENLKTDLDSTKSHCRHTIDGLESQIRYLKVQMQLDEQNHRSEIARERAAAAAAAAAANRSALGEQRVLVGSSRH